MTDEDILLKIDELEQTIDNLANNPSAYSVSILKEVLEKTLNNKGRDNKMNTIIILLSVLVSLGVFNLISLWGLAE